METTKPSTFVKKNKNYIMNHKIMSFIVILVVVWIGYWGYGKYNSTTGDNRYVSSAVTKGTIITSITGSGQISASNQIDLKPRASGNTNVSGNITNIAVSINDKVKQGQLLFSLDDRDAQKAVRNAETSLETAKLELEKFQQAPNTVDVLTIKKAITDAENLKLDAEKAVKDKYRDLLNTSIVALSMNPSDTQASPIISGTYIKGQEVTIFINIYQTGNGAYYNANSTPSGIVNGSGDATSLFPQPIGDSGLYIKFASNSSSQLGWTITLPNKSVAAYNTNLIAYQDAVDNQKKVNDTADLTIAQNNKKLDDLYNPNALDLRSKQLVVEQAQNTLDDAKQSLKDYSVTAPFSGVISSLPVQQGELVTSSTVLATLITEKKFAEISLNEVDMVGIKLREKTTLTFDAIPDFSIVGEVAEIDTIGTVSQGVVTYNVKISFDTKDARIKPGMSVSASIVTNIKQDVLVVPNSAVKTQGSSKYVEMFDIPLVPPIDGLPGSISLIPPNKITVVVGVSNDSETEIISGLKEGDEVVTRTILPTAVKTTTAPSILSGAGSGNRGGTVRIPGQ
ncbi:MAG: efflux RND transporter periplasmic adaptor subunit [Minisyncoccia bacterium]